MRGATWRRILCLAAALGPSAFVLAQGKPFMAPKFDGKFAWLKVGNLPSRTTRSLGSARSIVFDLSFSHDVILKKDAHGFRWFTFIVADQGSDWKWHQTSHSGGIPASGDVIKAGKYSISVPLEGIPKSVREDKMQTFSLGPGTSGLAKPISFSVDGWRAQ